MLTPLPTYSLTPSLPNLDPLRLLFFSFHKQPRCLLPHLRSFFKSPFLLRPLLVIQSKTANALPLHHTLFFFFSFCQFSQHLPSSYIFYLLTSLLLPQSIQQLVSSSAAGIFVCLVHCYLPRAQKNVWLVECAH